MQLELFKVKNTYAQNTKACKKCKIVKPLSSFRLYKRVTGNSTCRDSKCKDCSKHSNAIIAKLRLTAPLSKGICECCNKKSDRLVLDHCHEREIFRGWLCPTCNLGIGVLGDTLQGLSRALKYLERSENEH